RPDPATPRHANRGAVRSERQGDDGRSSARVRASGRRHRRGSIPPRQIAVEGSFAAVALASPTRRVVSGLTIVAIAVAIAVTIAAGCGLVAVAVGHMLDSAIG